MTNPPPDPEQENIRIRLLKVLRLAQEGVGGERENAEVLLAKLLRKHSMTLADLEGALDQPRTREWFPASDAEERAVLSQLVIRLFGTERKLWSVTNKCDLGVDVSPAERAALVIAWEVYRKAFGEARQALVMGFCFKHGLYAVEKSEAVEMSEDAKARAAHVIALANVLPVVDSPAHRLGSGDQSAKS